MDVLGQQPGAAGVALELAVSPAGHVYLETVPSEADLPEAAVAKRIRKSCNRSRAQKLPRPAASRLG